MSAKPVRVHHAPRGQMGHVDQARALELSGFNLTQLRSAAPRAQPRHHGCHDTASGCAKTLLIHAAPRRLCGRIECAASCAIEMPSTPLWPPLPLSPTNKSPATHRRPDVTAIHPGGSSRIPGPWSSRGRSAVGHTHRRLASRSARTSPAASIDSLGMRGPRQSAPLRPKRGRDSQSPTLSLRTTSERTGWRSPHTRMRWAKRERSPRSASGLVLVQAMRLLLPNRLARFHTPPRAARYSGGS
jgi:hypothetical protein